MQLDHHFIRLWWSSSILVVSFANHHIPHPTPTRKQCHDRIIMQICNTILPSSFRFILHARLLTHNLRMSYICHRPLSNYSSPFSTLFTCREAARSSRTVGRKKVSYGFLVIETSVYCVFWCVSTLF